MHQKNTGTLVSVATCKRAASVLFYRHVEKMSMTKGCFLRPLTQPTGIASGGPSKSSEHIYFIHNGMNQREYSMDPE